MIRRFTLALGLLAAMLVTRGVLAQNDGRSILGAGNEYLSAAAYSILIGNYYDGIRLTELGLTRYAPTPEDRTIALSNLCAAYAALGDPDTAIEQCTESLRLSSRNWRAYSNRAYAYWLKGMYSEARFDVDAALALNPDARQPNEILGMINEKSLQPRVVIEDHH